MSQFFASGDQSIGASASASVLPMNIQDDVSFGIDWLDLLAVQGTLKSLLQHLDNPMNRMKGQKDRTMKDEFLRLVGAQYATGDHWRNNSRKNEETEPKQKQHPVVDVTGDGSKVQ